MAKNEKNFSLGRVVVYGNPNYKYNGESGEWIKEETYDDKPTFCEVFDIQDLQKDRIVTARYVLPLADATISTSDEGLIYSYNCSLPYITETAHLAEVEKSMVIGQAFLYPGRNMPQNKPSIMVWVMVAFLMLLALIGMLT